MFADGVSALRKLIHEVERQPGPEEARRWLESQGFLHLLLANIEVTVVKLLIRRVLGGSWKPKLDPTVRDLPLIATPQEFALPGESSADRLKVEQNCYPLLTGKQMSGFAKGQGLEVAQSLLSCCSIALVGDMLLVWFAIWIMVTPLLQAHGIMIAACIAFGAAWVESRLFGPLAEMAWHHYSRFWTVMCFVPYPFGDKRRVEYKEPPWKFRFLLCLTNGLWSCHKFIRILLIIFLMAGVVSTILGGMVWFFIYGTFVQLLVSQWLIYIVKPFDVFEEGKFQFFDEGLKVLESPNYVSTWKNALADRDRIGMEKILDFLYLMRSLSIEPWGEVTLEQIIQSVLAKKNPRV